MSTDEFSGLPLFQTPSSLEDQEKSETKVSQQTKPPAKKNTRQKTPPAPAGNEIQTALASLKSALNIGPESVSKGTSEARDSEKSMPVANEPRHWSVTELTQHIRGILEPAFAQVWVKGEVSNFRPAASGHIYFSLKDEGANISAAIFGWGKSSRRQSFEINDGMQVLCRGKLSVYPPRGSYQLIIDQVEPLGAGALQVAFEQLKAKLASEGLFDPARKRSMPAYPSRIAVVTSPSGAAIRDMLNILARRAPHVRVSIIPAIVQGDEAAKQIIRGLELANRHRLGDVVVLARGGGSIEDLWCFNDENLARAIARSELPVVSAVGHEIDFTISDFVADLRAPTPSAAAELVTGHWVDAQRRLREGVERIRSAILRNLQTKKTLLAHIAARVVGPRDRLREQIQRCDELFSRLERAFKVRLDQRRFRLEQVMGKLDALSPLRVLERGYSIVRKLDGTNEGGVPVEGAVVKSADQVHAGQELRISFHEGETTVRVVAPEHP